MRRTITLVLIAALGVALLTQTGCVIRRERLADRPGNQAQVIERQFLLGEATDGEVVINMGAGELAISGDATQGVLLDGTFDYSPRALEPILETATTGTTNQVIVRSPKFDGFDLDFGRDDFRNIWDLDLGRETPMNVSVTLGAGDGKLDFRGVELKRLSVNIGAGEADIDLSGERTRSFETFIQAGAGEVTLRLPADVGVRVRGRQDGVGDWNYQGFRTDGNYLTNDAWETSDVKLDINLQRGIGEVNLELVD